MSKRERRNGGCAAFPDRGECRIQLTERELSLLRRLAAAVDGHEPVIAALWKSRLAAGTSDAPDRTSCELREQVHSILTLMREEGPEGLARAFRIQGKHYHEQEVPYLESCRSLHLLGECLSATLRELGVDDDEILEFAVAFGALRRERIIAIVEAYHQQCPARRPPGTECDSSCEAPAPGKEELESRLCGLIGASDPMQKVYASLRVAANCREPVLITGGTGTGKELAARTIHALSGDPLASFVPVNCAAISHDLIESELFGHMKGSFSGAHSDHEGLFRAAHGGTLFLDEVTELPVTAQAKLLRALQERAVRPVGGLREIPVDIRIVASTNRKVERVLEDGKLRRDFYYRLRHLVVRLPDLCERIEDIPLLVGHFARQAVADGLCSRVLPWTEAALTRLADHPWPGNVRELESVVRLTARLVPAGRILAIHLSREILDGGADIPTADAGTSPPVTLKDAERQTIARALEATKGNKTRAAGLLGISRKQLYVKIREYGLAT